MGTRGSLQQIEADLKRRRRKYRPELVRLESLVYINDLVDRIGPPAMEVGMMVTKDHSVANTPVL